MAFFFYNLSFLSFSLSVPLYSTLFLFPKSDIWPLSRVRVQEGVRIDDLGRGRDGLATRFFFEFFFLKETDDEVKKRVSPFLSLSSLPETLERDPQQRQKKPKNSNLYRE